MVDTAFKLNKYIKSEGRHIHGVKRILRDLKAEKKEKRNENMIRRANNYLTTMRREKKKKT